MEQLKKEHRPAGRPVKTVKKEIRITIRFSRSDFFIIKEKALKVGLKPSTYLRQLGITGEATPRLMDEERHFVRQLIGMANNLNQLTKACHQQGMLKGMAYFKEYGIRLDDLLKRLRK